MQAFKNDLTTVLHGMFDSHGEPVFTEQLKPKRLKENTVFILRHEPLDYIYLFARGNAYVVNHTLDGRRIIADNFTEPQIFGLVEAVNGDSSYRGTVVALSESLAYRVDKDDFLNAMYSDLRISSIVLRYLANLSIHAMQVSEGKTSRTAYENLIVYLYNKSLGKELPYRLKDNKSFIADSLQINKRSLYRYLNQLTDDNVIRREGQDILIQEESFARIEKLFNQINDR